MSCIPCVVEGDGCSIPLEDFDRWTDNLHHVIESRDGRRYFREFLTSRFLEESAATLEFWERAELMLRTPHHHKGHGRTSSVHLMRLQKEAKDLVDMAEDKINFDLAQMRCLYEALQSGREDKIRSTFQEAMQSACELLNDDYQLFRQHLLRQRRLLNEKR
ncbi:uncharacterized protein LOC111044818 [Nilaparvata lugens]|uniref:uncharacterized protein LOC111044818 n=1 Tax=Nilaparvata lugens TaxID=108931 RepID=UPI000B99B9A5|nr:uncharacterized protein LOC111044818 [Nilaparvata lugens]